jgi:hypothetical protein
MKIYFFENVISSLIIKKNDHNVTVNEGLDDKDFSGRGN